MFMVVVGYAKPFCKDKRKQRMCTFILLYVFMYDHSRSIFRSQILGTWLSDISILSFWHRLHTSKVYNHFSSKEFSTCTSDILGVVIGPRTVRPLTGHFIILYSKTCVKRPLKNIHNKCLYEKW